MIYNDDHVREMVKRYMEKHKVSLRGFAKEAGLSPTFISAFLNGKQENCGTRLCEMFGLKKLKGYVAE